MRRVELPYPGRFLWKGCRRLSCPVFLCQLQKKQKDGVGYIQKSSLNKLQQFIFSQRDGKQRFQCFHPGDGLRSFLFPRVKQTLPDRLTSSSLSCIVSFVICLLTLCVCLCVYSSGQTKGSERCRGMFTRHLSFALLESRWVSLMVCVCFVWPTVVGANKQRSSRVWLCCCGYFPVDRLHVFVPSAGGSAANVKQGIHSGLYVYHCGDPGIHIALIHWYLLSSAWLGL